MENLGKTLREMRKRMGKSQAEIAYMLNIPQTTWSNYEIGKAQPPLKILIKLAEMGYTIPGLTTGVEQDLKDKGLITDEQIRQRFEQVKDFPLDTPISELPPPNYTEVFKYSHNKAISIPTDRTDPNAIILLPLFSQRAAAGQGQPPCQLPVIEVYMPVLYELLNGANPKNCGMIRVIGDSMADMNLFNGDVVIFDRTQLEGDGVYVIAIGQDIRVKRLEYRPVEQKIIISSENTKRYPNPEAITYEQAENLLCIHGKVTGWVHRHPY